MVCSCPLRCTFYRSSLPPTHVCTLSLHDALPILEYPWPTPQERCLETLHCPTCSQGQRRFAIWHQFPCSEHVQPKSRSEEHTSELQSRENLVCRLLLEKKKAGASGPPHQPPVPEP